MKKVLFIIAVVLLVGCKKTDVKPVTVENLIGTWVVDSIYSNNRMAYPLNPATVIFKNSNYTFNGVNHVYELTVNQIVLDHFVNADLGFVGNALWIHENIANPVPNHFQDVRYYLSH